jgi:hypothetical protein
MNLTWHYLYIRTSRMCLFRYSVNEKNITLLIWGYCSKLCSVIFFLWNLKLISNTWHKNYYILLWVKMYHRHYYYIIIIIIIKLIFLYNCNTLLAKLCHRMKGKTLTTNKPTTVAIAYPNTPVSSAGSTSSLHLLLLAIAAAVVGPPTFALDANTTSLSGMWNSRPRPRVTQKCTVICIHVCWNRLGPNRATVGMWPIAPVTAKNI